MKSLVSFIFITLMASSSFAGWGDMFKPGRGGGHSDYRPNVTCSATDKGWEEHWGGHSDCNSCLKKHGSCTETCSAEYYSTTVKGRDYRGYEMTVESRGGSRYEAEREALRSCNYKYSECKVISTTSQSETVSRRSCK